MSIQVNEITSAEYPLLEKFLYNAIFLPPSVEPPPHEIVFEPEIHIYIKDFGCKDDCGVVAEQEGKIIGAAWTRIIPAYGHIDNDTPELSISVLPDYRGQGVGTMMMTRLFDLLHEHGYKRTSLSVQKDNPAVRFYQRLGYEIAGEKLDHVGHEDYIMVKELFANLRDVELARSLSADTTELLPYLPYVLQDYWELGSDPDVMARLIEKHISLSDGIRILDLACGKGAVSVKIANRLGVSVKGIDITHAFIEYAEQKAKEYGVDDLCEFVIGDINEAVKTERDYDCVILGAVGPGVLGGPAETLKKLKAVMKPGGYILIEEGYIPDEGNREKIRYNKDIHLTKQQWMDVFKDADLDLVETASGFGEGDLDSVSGMAAITARANELIEKYPDKKAMFEGYVRDQQNEYDDISDSLICVTWVLRKKQKVI